MERTICVKGTGKTKTRPDTVSIHVTVECCSMEYAQASKQAAEETEYLREALVKAAFKREDLKTAAINVETVYRSERDRNGNYKSIFDGYRCTHSLLVEFGFDSGRLEAALTAITGSVTAPEFRVRFRVKDTTAVTNELLRTAAIDANVKALTLCEASGVELGELVSINYSWEDINLYSDSMVRLSCCDTGCDVAPDFDIEPEDIETADTVTFIWSIKGGK